MERFWKWRYPALVLIFVVVTTHCAPSFPPTYDVTQTVTPAQQQQTDEQTVPQLAVETTTPLNDNSTLQQQQNENQGEGKPSVSSVTTLAGVTSSSGILSPGTSAADDPLETSEVSLTTSSPADNAPAETTRAPLDSTALANNETISTEALTESASTAEVGVSKEVNTQVPITTTAALAFQTTSVSDLVTESLVQNASSVSDVITEAPVKVTTSISGIISEASLENTPPISDNITEAPIENTTVSDVLTETPVEITTSVSDIITEAPVEITTPVSDIITEAPVETTTSVSDIITEAPVETTTSVSDTLSEAPILDSTTIVQNAQTTSDVPAIPVTLKAPSPSATLDDGSLATEEPPSGPTSRNDPITTEGPTVVRTFVTITGSTPKSASSNPVGDDSTSFETSSSSPTAGSIPVNDSSPSNTPDVIVPVTPEEVSVTTSVSGPVHTEAPTSSARIDDSQMSTEVLAASTALPNVLTTESPADNPTTESPTSITSLADNPTTESPTSITSLADNPTTESPTSITSLAENPTTESPTSITSLADNPTTESPTSITSLADNPTTESPTSIKSLADNATTESPTSINSLTDNATTEPTSSFITLDLITDEELASDTTSTSEPVTKSDDHPTPPTSVSTTTTDITTPELADDSTTLTVPYTTDAVTTVTDALTTLVNTVSQGNVSGQGQCALARANQCVNNAYSDMMTSFINFIFSKNVERLTQDMCLKYPLHRACIKEALTSCSALDRLLFDIGLAAFDYICSNSKAVNIVIPCLTNDVGDELRLCVNGIRTSFALGGPCEAPLNYTECSENAFEQKCTSASADVIHDFFTYTFQPFRDLFMCTTPPSHPPPATTAQTTFVDAKIQQETTIIPSNSTENVAVVSSTSVQPTREIEMTTSQLTTVSNSSLDKETVATTSAKQPPTDVVRITTELLVTLKAETSLTSSLTERSSGAPPVVTSEPGGVEVTRDPLIERITTTPVPSSSPGIKMMTITTTTRPKAIRTRSTAATTKKRTTTAIPKANLSIQCFDCNSGNPKGWRNPHCPVSGNLTRDMVAKVSCSKPCFTKETKFPAGAVYRGCSVGWDYTFPRGIPSGGCHTVNGDKWCFCSTDNCNTRNMEESFSTSLP